MLVLYFNILRKRDDLDLDITNFLYSVYGNNGYKLKGIFDISKLNYRDEIPQIFIRCRQNRIFFLKIKFVIEKEDYEESEFFDLNNLTKEENLNINILDKSLNDI